MIVVADPQPGLRKRLVELLAGRGAFREIGSLQEVEAMAASEPEEATVLILGPGLASLDALAAAGKLQVAQPAISVLLIARVLSSDLLQAALRAGVRDVLPASFSSEQLIKAYEHAESIAGQMRARTTRVIDLTDPEPEENTVISVLSSKGGVGKSFVSSNLATLLAGTGADVALVDLDLQFGDLAIMLQLIPSRSIADIAENMARVDAESIRGYLTRHRSGVNLLASPPEPGLADLITSQDVLATIRMLKEQFRYVVIDTPPAFADHVLAAIDESAVLVLVSTMDVPSIKNIRISLQTLDLLGIERDRMRVVLNRADSKVGLKMLDVEKTLQTRIDVAIPSSREVPLSINRGVPIVLDEPGSPPAQALTSLCASIAGKNLDRAASPEAASAGGWRRVLGRTR